MGRLDESEWEDLVLELNTLNRCGWPSCGNPNKAKGKYMIQLSKKRVLSGDEMSRYCCERCCVKALRLKSTLAAGKVVNNAVEKEQPEPEPEPEPTVVAVVTTSNVWMDDSDSDGSELAATFSTLSLSPFASLINTLTHLVSKTTMHAIDGDVHLQPEEAHTATIARHLPIILNALAYPTSLSHRIPPIVSSFNRSHLADISESEWFTIICVLCVVVEGGDLAKAAQMCHLTVEEFQVLMRLFKQ